jgi:hypothetical protein
MSFGVELSNEVLKMIAGWQLPGIVQLEILERLYEELAPHPSKHLRRLPPPADNMEYSFCMTGVGDPPLDYLFAFNVVYASDEETIVIKDCLYMIL